MQRQQLLTPEHPEWNDFVEQLEGPNGCNFRLKDPNDPKSTTWDCGGGNDKSLAFQILVKMGTIDVDSTFEYFEQNGGHCDCEILFNVDRKD